jgi:hypothetical protein
LVIGKVWEEFWNTVPQLSKSSIEADPAEAGEYWNVGKILEKTFRTTNYFL